MDVQFIDQTPAPLAEIIAFYNREIAKAMALPAALIHAPLEIQRAHHERAYRATEHLRRELRCIAELLPVPIALVRNSDVWHS